MIFSIEIRMQKLNQVIRLNIFLNFQCKFIPGHGWKTGSYECICREGFFKHNITHFDGPLVERKLIIQNNNKTNSVLQP